MLSHTVYFLLDIENSKLYLYKGGSEWATLKELKESVEYILSVGSIDKAIIEESNKIANDFNPFEGI